ncbi:DUF6011 domain-containing protein [Mycolicibacterium boenickei]
MTLPETIPEAAPSTDDLAGWRIAVRCSVCGHWLTDPASVLAGVGPKCGGVSE